MEMSREGEKARKMDHWLGGGWSGQLVQGWKRHGKTKTMQETLRQTRRFSMAPAEAPDAQEGRTTREAGGDNGGALLMMQAKCHSHRAQRRKYVGQCVSNSMSGPRATATSTKPL